MPTRETSPAQGRVSDYNPETLLADLSTAPPPGPSPATQSQQWTTPGQETPESTFPPPGSDAHLSLRARKRWLWYEKQKRRRVPPTLSDPYRYYLQEVGAFLQLPQSTTDALLPIYISLLDDLIPVVDGSTVYRNYSNGQSSQYLVRAMCLVACKAKQAAPFLRLGHDEPVLGSLEFSGRILEGLDAAIKADLEPDRITKVKILALMHLHNDGPGGLDRSSSCLSQAISEAWAICLHWDFAGKDDREDCNFLWWSLRNLDRLNKPIMGASPFLIDDTDIGIKRITPHTSSYRSQVMGVATALGDIMKIATRVYKASSAAVADDSFDFPSVEEVTSGLGFDSFHQLHRGTFALPENQARTALIR